MTTVTKASRSSEEMLLVSQKVWFQQAIWNKFGCPLVRHTSLQDLMHSTAILFASARVAKYIVRVNQLVDEALSFIGKDKSASSRSADLRKEGLPIGTNCRRLQLSNQTWFQLAVWNRFGSKSSEPASLQELEQVTADLFASAEVANFIICVNSMIDGEMNVEEEEVGKQAESTSSNVDIRNAAPSSPTHTMCSDASSALSSHSDMGVEDNNIDTELVRMHTKHGSLFGSDSLESSRDSQDSDLVDSEYEDEDKTKQKKTHHANEEEVEEEAEDEDKDEVVVLSSTVTPYAAGGSKCVKKESVLKRWFGEGGTLRSQEGTTNAFKMWTPDQEALLAQLVPVHSSHGRTNWKAIGKILRRTPGACQSKYSQQKGEKEGGTCTEKRQCLRK